MALTLSEAKKQWGVSYDALCWWLDCGFIPEVELNDGVVTVGETKPYVPKRGTTITVEKVCKYILTACENLEYIDFHILNIPMEQFTAILLQLEEKRYIQRNIPDANCKSNRHFTITEDGEKSLKKRKFELEELNFGLNFKYFSLDAKIRKDL